ncbi:MAG: molecular chaperone HtpG [Burkholderiaceae bacterium]|nr:molecular chaperone HtpG [Burkholderiaceae bacterium]
MEAQDTPTRETLGFQAEVKQLLQLMIHSLYSNKEIFLRELISNASDACDKLRFEAMSKPALLEGHGELGITVSFDKAARTITVSDNGIGMSRTDTIEHLGTIAKSGTREFFAQLSGDQQRDAQLIGQFGVGFYSSFIVADRVTVVSRRAGEEAASAVRWESDGGGEFTVEPASRAESGTDVTLHLREGEDEFLAASKLRSVLTHYSDHISLPIRMRKEVWDKDKNEYRPTDELETINQASALWARAKADITDEQYREFYKHVSHDFGDPLAWTHNRVEGRTEYIQLLYLPERAAFDLWDRQQRHGLKLYVKRVFIMEDAGDLLPAYLRFVRGVIDSSDLPLNVSREILQQSRDVKAIREGSTKRVLGMLEDLAENRRDKYASFWKEFGQVLKEGVGEDAVNRERIAKLLRFASTRISSTTSDQQSVSLAEYVARIQDRQKAIYYVTADSLEAGKASPHLEIFRRKEVEVLILTDRVDEWMLSFLNEFEGKALTSVAKGDLDLGELADAQEKEEQRKVVEQSKDLVEAVKSALGERVKDVRVTLRLTDSPACVVADEHAMSQHLQRLLKAAGQDAPAAKPILELNPHHPLVQRLKPDDKQLPEWSALLLDQAVLAEGGQLQNPADFVKRLNAMLLNAGS